MATGTAMPELFVNIISTFLTESDMGLGTIIGSLMFNILGVAGIACFFAIHTINLDWWPITRDSVIFTVIASFLIGFGWDGRIEWYESMILVILIIFYYGLMIFNARLQRGIRYLLEDRLGCCANIAICMLFHKKLILHFNLLMIVSCLKNVYRFPKRRHYHRKIF